MNELIKVKKVNEVLVTSSKNLATVLGKEHKNIIRDLEKILESSNVSSLIIPSTYKVQGQSRKYKQYLLTKDGLTLYMFNIQGYNEEKLAYINKFNEMEKQLQNKFPVPTTFKEALLLAVKQQEQIEQLELENLKKDKEITYKEDVIIGLVDNIDLSTKRQRITQIINKGAKRGNYSDRWNILYREFEKKYHLNLRARIDKCQISPKVKNKIDYIERVLEMIPQLYELTCKIFENDVEKLKHEWFDNI